MMKLDALVVAGWIAFAVGTLLKVKYLWWAFPFLAMARALP